MTPAFAGCHTPGGSLDPFGSFDPQGIRPLDRGAVPGGLLIELVPDHLAHGGLDVLRAPLLVAHRIVSVGVGIEHPLRVQ